MPAKGIERVYFSLEVSPTQRLMLFRQTYRGGRYIHLRTWYQPEAGAEFRPGRGLVLPSNPVTLHELADALHELASDYPWTGAEENPDGCSGFPPGADNRHERVERDDPGTEGRRS